MKRCWLLFTASCFALVWWVLAGRCEDKNSVSFPHFRMQEIETALTVGYGVLLVDINGDGNDELIISVRDNLANEPGKRCGVRIYKALNSATKWARDLIDEAGVAVEDLAAADLNGDGRIDIVAVGRQTHNIRIYWNEGKSKK